MKLFERYLLSRVERALDDGKPLTGLTRLFVLRHQRLRHYYESQLALELELRFSDVPAIEPMILSRPAVSVQRKNRRLIIVIATASCLLFVIGLIFYQPSEEPMNTSIYPAIPSVAYDEGELQNILAESLIDFSERPLEQMSMFFAQVGSAVSKHFPNGTPDSPIH